MHKIINSKKIKVLLLILIVSLSSLLFFYPLGSTSYWEDTLMNGNEYSSKISIMRWYIFIAPAIVVGISILLIPIIFIKKIRIAFWPIFVLITCLLAPGFVFLGLMNDYDWFLANLGL